MPRGRKKAPVNYEEQIAIIDADIEKAENKLRDLKNKKKDLVTAKEQVGMQQIYEVVKNSGKSIDEILTQITTNAE